MQQGNSKHVQQYRPDAQIFNQFQNEHVRIHMNIYIYIYIFVSLLCKTRPILLQIQKMGVVGGVNEDWHTGIKG